MAMGGRGPFSSAGAIIGWLLVAGLVFAVMTLWNWDPISFATHTVERVADFFLGMEWFRKLVGSA